MAKLPPIVNGITRIASLQPLPEQLHAFFELTQDPQIQELVPAAQKSEREFGAEATYARYNDDYYIAIFDNNTNEMVGGIIAKAIFARTLHLQVSIFTKASARKKGYMSSALTTFINALPSPCTLIFRVLHSNLPSLNTISKIEGFEEVTTLPEDPYRQFEKHI